MGNERFDFSNLTREHLNNGDKHKMVPGKFKDESPNNLILEFVGSMSKIYLMKMLHGDNRAVAKGVQQCITNRPLRHEDYKVCLIDNEEMHYNK